MKKPALVVDIDGTLALRTERSWFDFDRVGEDVPNWPVANLLKDMHRYHNVISGTDIALIAVSGRPATCYVETEAWLERYHIPHHMLLMRDPKWVDSSGNMLPDWYVKERIYDEVIDPDYEVMFVVDDRPSVCRMWRRRGLPVFQVGDPDVEF
ncbi:hypothetical protein K8O93_00865 [Gordonia bronchialis]|uniref:phosphatase domain-containing protein n=1 Tax=Gordonia bronchialis TaxID=2054 RepID=UPI001CC0FCF1|nr:hypothetical protein [Gordonia bronchialis]UAK38384.1 hypothetical protein K8O93_00865 [Gordonia bronchialis]